MPYQEFSPLPGPRKLQELLASNSGAGGSGLASVGIETGDPKIYHGFQTDRMNFTAFSRCLPYRREAMELMLEALSYLPDNFTQVDIGAGNGLAAQVTKGVTEAFLRRATVLGIDPDPYAIEQASKDTPSSERCKVAFIKGFGQDVESFFELGRIPGEGVDLVSILDAVHEFPPDDQAPIIKAGTNIVKPGGIVAMNSTFTSIATVDNQSAWAMPAGRAAIKLGGKRTGREAGLLLRDPDEYTQMGLAAGLVLVYYKVVPVVLPTSAVVDINKYPGWVQGIKSSFTFFKDGQVYEPTLEQLSNELQLSYARSKPLSRNWSRWIFQKPSE